MKTNFKVSFLDESQGKIIKFYTAGADMNK